MKFMFLFLNLLCCSFIFAADSQYFKQGVEAYKSGNYDEAIERFNQVSDEGLHGVSLFYNIGNCYFRKAEVIPAILYYEKALELNPGHEDALFNLQLAKEALPRKQTIDPALSPFTWVTLLAGTRTPDGWAFLSIQLLVLAILGMFMYLYATRRSIRKLGNLTAIIAGSFFIVTTIVSLHRKSSLYQEEYAIVMQPVVKVLSAPGNTGTALFEIRGGWKVKLSGKSDDWREITMPDGNRGWIKSEDLGMI